MNPLLIDNSGCIIPDWPAPENIRALVTTRISFQQSESIARELNGYDSFNLALHVNDKQKDVLANRATLAQHLNVSNTRIAWLEQVHGTQIVDADVACQQPYSSPTQADALISHSHGTVCSIMTADCLPVLFCNTEPNPEKQLVAAAHAGWRGLADGILSKTLATFPSPENVIAWLGPAISQQHFEVGQDVYDAFVNKNPKNAEAFIAGKRINDSEDKWFASLTMLAKIELEEAGIKGIYGGDWCTYAHPELFYSYRRDGSQSGRMASLIMIEE